jgi:hypothetical protein
MAQDLAIGGVAVAALAIAIPPAPVLLNRLIPAQLQERRTTSSHR